ncbi:neuropeptide CCHamide-1 receptor-like [Anabrus simplex]|uniref:neuropeptide CCHamide-1 receptor-like n=1 Tax=Anabrus simplex TaxID=316456 RepID=UPI0034DCEFE3
MSLDVPAFNLSNSSIWDNGSVNSSEFPLRETSVTPYSERLETYIVPALFAVIFLVGVLGNGTLVFIFLRHRNMRNVPNTYIFSLALGDLLVILTCVPFTSTLYTFDSWPYGEVICKLSECAKDVSIGVSVFTLTALSAERYCAIVSPMRRHVGGGRLSAKAFTLLVAVGIWVLAFLFALPDTINSYIREVPIPDQANIEVCFPFPEEMGPHYARIIVMMKFLVYYAIPLCIIACFYILMARHLELSTQNMPGERQGQSTQIRARKKVAKMVLAFVIIFILCFLPYHTFMLWFHFNPDSQYLYDDYWHALRIIGFCLSFINSCINPIALYFISGAFRKHFNQYLFCCCTDQSSRHSLSRRGNSEMSSHSLVHFNSTFRRHHTQLEELNCSITTASSSVFNLDKT